MSQTCLPYVLMCNVIFCLASSALGAEVVLPEGSAPPPIVSRHFPDRVHEFVWRNWNAVAPATLAKILGASADEVTELATSMGLPAEPTIPPQMKTRGYSTLIRRNWHLLPYEQLLDLVDMTPERLAFTLREDDFLWVKLGQLKPQCEPLRYQAPDEAARQRAAEIRRVVETDFGAALRLPAEPRFDFVRQLSSPLPAHAPPERTADQPVSLRFVYSYLAVYGDPLSDPSVDPYPDGFLERLSAVGVNGVWLHVVLRDLAPGGTAFPEFGAGHEQRLANLRVLVQRAKKHGVGVYLYMNEPRNACLLLREPPGHGRCARGGVHGTLHFTSGRAPMDGGRADVRISAGARPGRRLCHHGVRESDKLRIARRLGFV